MTEIETRSESAYRQLLTFMSDLSDGARLPSESDFVGMLNLSRPSIREALARLRAEGLVRSRKGSGSYAVREPAQQMLRLSAIENVKDLIEWHEFRLALESEVAALAADRRTDEDLDRLVQAQAALLEQLWVDRADAEDVAFHAALAACAHNSKLADALGRLTSHIFSWGSLSAERGVLTLSERRELITFEHGGIIDAVTSRNSDRARAEIRRHLLSGRMRVLGSIEGSR